MNVPEKHRAVAHAWVDGAEAEIKLNGEWVPMIGGGWPENWEIRIKPKPLKLEVGKRYRCDDGLIHAIKRYFLAGRIRLYVDPQVRIYDKSGKYIWSEHHSCACDLIAEVKG